jgi:MoxR-like ATPase
MLEAMQERQTSIGGVEHKLPDPFFVIATQNPIEQEGTYHLPEAQLDRFLLKDIVDYPNPQEELEILNRLEAGTLDPSHTVDSISLEDLKFLQGLVKKVYIDEALRQHIINIIWATRHPEGYLTEQQVRVLEYGASPRASIAFFQVAKANALLEGRTYVIPEDVKVLRHEVLRHRLILSYEADVEGIKVEDIIDTLFDSIPIP